MNGTHVHRFHVMLLLCALLVLFTIPVTSLAQEKTDKSKERTLQQELKELLENDYKTVPANIMRAGEVGIEEIRNSGILSRALNVGKSIPDFTLPDAEGKMVSSSGLLKKGPMLLIFYRGSWCPYCNLYLHTLERHIKEFQALGATIVAVTPEVPDSSIDPEAIKSLKFTVLSDQQFKVAYQFHIVYDIPKVINDVVLEQGLDFTEYLNTDKPILALTASYIIDQKGIIRYAWLNPDYHRHPEPADLLSELRKLRK